MSYYHHGKNIDDQFETPFITGKVHFEIRCAVCGYGLCKKIDVTKTTRRKQNIILVDPCPNCAAGGEPVKLDSEYQQT